MITNSDLHCHVGAPLDGNGHYLLSFARRSRWIPKLLQPMRYQRDVCDPIELSCLHAQALTRFPVPEATPTSIAFVSSDNVTFYIDRAKLDRAADFSPPALVSSSPTDPVRLAESSETLELLFRFVYCDVDIDLTSHSFYDIEKLAMSAEKYQVFSALAVCRLYMKYVRWHYWRGR